MRARQIELGELELEARGHREGENENTSSKVLATKTFSHIHSQFFLSHNMFTMCRPGRPLKSRAR